MLVTGKYFTGPMKLSRIGGNLDVGAMFLMVKDITEVSLHHLLQLYTALFVVELMFSYTLCSYSTYLCI